MKQSKKYIKQGNKNNKFVIAYQKGSHSNKVKSTLIISPISLIIVLKAITLAFLSNRKASRSVELVLLN